jgi:hypothetical protein
MCQDESIHSFTNFPGPVVAAMSPDRRFLAAISGMTLRLLDYENRRETALEPPSTGQNFTALAFLAPETNKLVTISGQTLLIWDLASSSVTSSVTLSNTGAALAISADGKFAALSKALWDRAWVDALPLQLLHWHRTKSF